MTGLCGRGGKDLHKPNELTKMVSLYQYEYYYCCCYYYFYFYCYLCYYYYHSFFYYHDHIYTSNSSLSRYVKRHLAL